MDEMKNTKFIHKKYLVMMIAKVKEHMEKQKSLVDINIPRYFLILIIPVTNISMFAAMCMGSIMTCVIFLR